MLGIDVSDSCNNHTDNTVLETTSRTVADGLTDDLPVLREVEEFLDENIRLYITRLEFQRIINSALFKYKENTLTQLTDGIIQNTMETLLRTTAREATKRTLSHMYGAWRILSSRL